MMESTGCVPKEDILVEALMVPNDEILFEITHNHFSNVENLVLIDESRQTLCIQYSLSNQMHT